MLCKTRLIVKTHYSFNLASPELQSTINGLLENENFCLEEGNPYVSLNLCLGVHYY